MTVPGNLSSPLLATAAAAAAAVVGPTKSLRFNGNGNDDPHLERTVSSASNRRTFTFAAWVKNDVKTSNHDRIFSAGTSSSNIFDITLSADSEGTHLRIYNKTTTVHTNWNTVNKFRDPSAWFHVVCAIDTTQATQANRVKVYINGTHITDNGTTNTLPSQNAQMAVNDAVTHYIGRSGVYGDDQFAGYLADIYFIDGSQLDPTSFGAFDDSGVWQAATYSGTFGTNGFHLLDFANESTIGHDSSGNENDFTAFNFLESSGQYINAVSGTARSGFPFSQMFDGRLDHGALPAASTSYTFTPTTSIPFSTLHVYAYKDSSPGTLKINGTDVTSQVPNHNGIGPNQRTQITGISSPLTSIQNISNGNLANIVFAGLEIDGELLLDKASEVDVLFDVPTNGGQTDTGAGGEVGGNYATLNPLQTGSSLAISNGNLALDGHSSWRSSYSTIFLPSGKWYFEVTIRGITSHSYGILVGLAGLGTNIIESEISSGDSYAVQNGPGNMKISYNSGSTDLGSQSAYAVGDVLQLAYDADNGKLWFGKNGTYINSGNPSAGSNEIKSGISGTYCFAVALLTTSDKIDCNFGQRAWAYSAPTNFKAVCTTNLPTPTVPDGSKHFNAKLWTGTGQSHAITGYGFSPDFAWIKSRSNTASHALFDIIRGNSSALRSDNNLVQVTGNSSIWTSFDSDGFTLGVDNNNGWTNWNTWTYVGWAWNAGANSNKTYTVKVVSDSGNKFRFDDFGSSAVTLDLAEGSTYIFDQSDSSNAGHPIRFGTSANGTDYTTGVTHTGTPGSAGAKTTLVLGTGVSTLYYSCANHSGMGGQINTNSTGGSSNFDGTHQATIKANPEAGFSICKFTTPSGDTNHTFGHGLNSAPEFIIYRIYDENSVWWVHVRDLGANNYLYLHENNAKAVNNFVFNNSLPTDTIVRNYGSNAYHLNENRDMIYYCFAPVEGYSAVGTYEGNGSNDGPFIFTGFKVAFLIRKSADSTKSWSITDSTRNTYNEIEDWLEPNTGTAEQGAGYADVDFLSNGFKIRTNGAVTNSNNTTYIYYAVAENPFAANGGLAR